MIPDTAMIVAIYVVVRLLNDYVLTSPKAAQARVVLALIGVGLIAVFAVDVLAQAGSVNL